MDDTPKWLTVGARVVEFTPTRSAGCAKIEETTVTKIGKRDVVLANGERYNVGTLRHRRGAWDASTDLLPHYDPRVEAARRANLRSNRLAKAQTAWEAFRRTPDEEQGDALITAVKRYVAALVSERGGRD